MHEAPGKDVGRCLDFDLKGLPADADVHLLKKAAGVKQIVSAIVDCDSLTNACTGTGRLKVRLS